MNFHVGQTVIHPHHGPALVSKVMTRKVRGEDVEYAELAHGLGVAPYLRAPAAGVAPDFIGALAAAVTEALGREGTAPHGPGCRKDWKACPCQTERRAA